MTKHLCTECGLVKKCAVITKTRDKFLVWVCGPCWNMKDYTLYVGPFGNHV
jgi:hypothetical protein